MKTVGIYKITSPSNKVYIGQSRNIRHRFNCYKRLLCQDQPRLYNSLKKYGAERHKFDIIHTCGEDELNRLEVYYIELYQCFNSEHGLNLCSGGDAYKLSDEAKKKIGLANKGRPGSRLGKKHSEETKRKIGEANKKMSAENRQKLSDRNKGKKLSQELKCRISATLKSKWKDNEFRAKMLSNLEKRKPISKEGRQRQAESRKRNGYRHSPETIEKMKIAAKNRIYVNRKKTG